jgi:hypothetical protein
VSAPPSPPQPHKKGKILGAFMKLLQELSAQTPTMGNFQREKNNSQNIKKMFKQRVPFQTKQTRGRHRITERKGGGGEIKWVLECRRLPLPLTRLPQQTGMCYRPFSVSAWSCSFRSTQQPYDLDRSINYVRGHWKAHLRLRRLTHQYTGKSTFFL